VHDVCEFAIVIIIIAARISPDRLIGVCETVFLGGKRKGFDIGLLARQQFLRCSAEVPSVQYYSKRSREPIEFRVNFEFHAPLVKMIFSNVIGALTSDSNTLWVALLSLVVLGVYILFSDRFSENRGRQISLLPSITRTQWTSLIVSLKLASFGPRGKYRGKLIVYIH